MSKKQNLYLGKSGEFAVISEFLFRGWNVAIPQIDTGDDAFVIEDKTGFSTRIQVKSTVIIDSKSEFAVQFYIPFQQLKTPAFPELIYVFAIRDENYWNTFILFSRNDLYNLLANQTENEPKSVNLKIKLRDCKFIIKGGVWMEINNFEAFFPKINH